MNKHQLIAFFKQAQTDRLDSLFLNQQNIQSIPLQIKLCNYPELSVLDLNGNQLRQLPSELFCLENLRYLDLSDNQLQHIPKEIGQLKKLEYLRLDGNALTSIPTELSQCTQLKTLHLERNHLRNIPLQFLKHKNLQDHHFEYDDTYLDSRSVFRGQNAQKALQFLERNQKEKNRVAFLQFMGITELQALLVQYCSFFETYLRITKGIDVYIRLAKSERGLGFDVEGLPAVPNIRLNQYLKEYLSFLSAPRVLLADKLEIAVLKRDLELLKIQIQMLVNNYERQLDVLRLANKIPEKNYRRFLEAIHGISALEVAKAG